MGTQAADRLGDLPVAERTTMSAVHEARTLLDPAGTGNAAGRLSALRSVENGEPLLKPADPSTPVLDTSELRWFADGPLVRNVAEWFTCGGTLGAVEERCDTYQLNGLLDLGIKLRASETLEVKSLAGVGDTMHFGAGVEAHVEEWRKWNPAAGESRWNLPNAEWIDVHKVVLTRLFTPPGEELRQSEHRPEDMPAGCEVELVALRAGEVIAWTLAFEAFGPPAHRRSALAASWEALTADSPPPTDLHLHFTVVGGYPQWLGLLTPPPLAISG